MDNFLQWLKQWQLHPVADHFTIAILVIGVLFDLAASLASTRLWLRYTALTLMIGGAIAAAASWFTGGALQPEWVWKAVPAAAKPLLHRHARLGELLMWVFIALAIWRILLQGFTFMVRSRAIYLIIAVLAIVTLCYQGHLGGALVYNYGVGTIPSEQAKAAAAQTSIPSPAASVAAAPSTIPTVSVPTSTPSAAAPTVAPTPNTNASPKSRSMMSTPTATPHPSAVPSPTATTKT